MDTTVTAILAILGGQKYVLGHGFTQDLLFLSSGIVGFFYPWIQLGSVVTFNLTATPTAGPYEQIVSTKYAIP